MTAPLDEPLPLITARCARCYRVAAKYWERGGEGRWITPNPPYPPNEMSLQHMVAAQVCRCKPPPTLPEGDELAALIDRAHAKRFDRRRAEADRGPVTIRV